MIVDAEKGHFCHDESRKIGNIFEESLKTKDCELQNNTLFESVLFDRIYHNILLLTFLHI